MSCQDSICRLVTCPVTDDIPSYLGGFSLQNGLIFTNTLISVPVTYGDGFYYVPPGAITIPVPPNGGLVSYQGCQSTLSATVPAGSTTAATQAIINDLMNQIAQQLSVCNAPKNPNNPSNLPVYWNDQSSVGCSGGKQIASASILPPPLFIGNNLLTCPPGIFSSTISKDDANLKCVSFLIEILNNPVFISCGINPNCPDWSTVTWTPNYDPGFPFNTSGSGFVTMTPSPSGLQFTGGATAGINNRAFLNTFGTVNYTGQACNCNLHVDYTATGLLTGNGYVVVVFSAYIGNCDVPINYFTLLNHDGVDYSQALDFCTSAPFPFVSNPTGTYDFPFSLPLQPGPTTVNIFVYVVFLGNFDTGNNWSVLNGDISVTGAITLTNI